MNYPIELENCTLTKDHIIGYLGDKETVIKDNVASTTFATNYMKFQNKDEETTRMWTYLLELAYYEGIKHGRNDNK